MFTFCTKLIFESKALIAGVTDILRIVESFSCGYFVWDSVVMILFWQSKGTDYFGMEGVIHGVTCAIVYLVTLVSLLSKDVICTIERKTHKFPSAHLACISQHYIYYLNTRLLLCI